MYSISNRFGVMEQSSILLKKSEIVFISPVFIYANVCKVPSAEGS
jgi:hypothetical protein